MRKLKILITTIGGLTSPDLFYALKNNGEREIVCYGIDSFEWAICRNMVAKFAICPNSAKDEKKFAKFVQSFCIEHNIDLIIPCGNEDNLALAKYRDLIDTPIMISPYTSLVQSYDKGLVYQALQKHLPQHCPKFKIFNSYAGFKEALSFLNFPQKKIVIKPRNGRGGRGVYIINSSFDFQTFFSKKPENEVAFETIDSILRTQENFEDLIAMEYLQDPFISAYSLCQDGNNLLTLKHIREWGNASQTYRGLVSYDAQLEEICSSIIKLFNLSYTNNMELAHNENGDIILFDLNPRIGASSSIDSDIGLNFPYLAIKLLLQEDFSINKQNFLNSKRFIRHFTHFWTHQL